MRKRSYNRGRWHLERERHGLTGNVPPADAEETGVRDVVAGVLQRLGMDNHIWLRELEPVWPALMGPAVAAHTRPGQYNNGYLTIFVDSAAWLSELSRYGQREMLGKLQARFGAANIRAIRLQPDPDGPAAAAPRRFGSKRNTGPSA